MKEYEYGNFIADNKTGAGEDWKQEIYLDGPLKSSCLKPLTK